MVNEKILDTIRKEIIERGRDTRYKLQAYNFILNGLDFYRTKVGERRHFTGQELSHGLLEFAQAQFGPLARRTLAHWGVNSTDDFGYLVYNLIDIKLIRKQERDSLRDFFEVVDFDGFFDPDSCYQIDREHIKSIKGA
jgi:uncharacterized repeat protein (TIGR04138 family)